MTQYVAHELSNKVFHLQKLLKEAELALDELKKENMKLSSLLEEQKISPNTETETVDCC